MKKLANVFVVIAILSAIAAIVCRIKLAPIIGLPAKSYLAVANTSLLFAITFLLLEKTASK
jgi:uncharacterized MnhB-related membrane protein